MRNDPARLEAEAKELIEQYANATKGTSEEDSPEEQEQTFEPPPTEPTDTVEAEATEEVQAEESSGDDSEARVLKAEKAMKGAQRRMTQATQEAAELRKQNESLIQSLTELKAQLVASSKDNEKLAQLREEYPDIASPLLDELQRTQAEVANTKDALAEQDRIRRHQDDQQAMQEHYSRIQAVHPDVQEVTNTSDWAVWLEEQEPQTRAWIESGTSNDVNAVISRFKVSMGIRPPTPQEQNLERAKAVAEPRLPKARKTDQNASTNKVWSADDIARMPNLEFEKHQSEIMKAYAEGRIR
jgi:chromosome segregation ATPase